MSKLLRRIALAPFVLLGVVDRLWQALILVALAIGVTLVVGGWVAVHPGLSILVALVAGAGAIYVLKGD